MQVLNKLAFTALWPSLLLKIIFEPLFNFRMVISTTELLVRLEYAGNNVLLLHFLDPILLPLVPHLRNVVDHTRRVSEGFCRKNGPSLTLRVGMLTLRLRFRGFSYQGYLQVVPIVLRSKPTHLDSDALGSASYNYRAFRSTCEHSRSTVLSHEEQFGWRVHRLRRQNWLPSSLRPQRSSLMSLACVNSTFTANTSGALFCSTAAFFSEYVCSFCGVSAALRG